MQTPFFIAALSLVLACQRAEDATANPSASPAAPAAVPTSTAATPEVVPPIASKVGGGGAAQLPPVAGAVAPPVNPSPPPSERAVPSRSPPSCRATSLSGSIERAGAPVRVGMTLGGPPALELAPAAALHLTHALSARQWTVSGPARLIACDGGAEELTLARGSLRAEPGSGVRPGAEVWVGTPYGSLRYADASAEISVNERELSVRVSTGKVWFTPLTGDAVERPLSSTTARFAAKAYRLSSERARARCGGDAEQAERLASALLRPSTQPLGARAAEHVRARQRAHASCASALAATLADERTPRPEAGYAALARYDDMWRGVPTPPGATAPAAP